MSVYDDPRASDPDEGRRLDYFWEYLGGEPGERPPRDREQGAAAYWREKYDALLESSGAFLESVEAIYRRDAVLWVMAGAILAALVCDVVLTR